MPHAVTATPALRRALSVRDLVVFGLLFIGPLATVGFFGVLDARADGAVALVFVLPPMRASMRCQTCGDGVTGGSEVLKGSSRSCQAPTAARSVACAGNSASKRRRAGPRSVPST